MEGGMSKAFGLSQFLSMKQKRGIDLVNQTLPSVKLHSLTSKAIDPFEQVLFKNCIE